MVMRRPERRFPLKLAGGVTLPFDFADDGDRRPVSPRRAVEMRAVEPHETSTAEGPAALLQRIETYAQGKCRLITNGGVRNPKSKECADDMVKQTRRLHVRFRRRGLGRYLAAEPRRRSQERTCR